VFLPYLTVSDESLCDEHAHCYDQSSSHVAQDILKHSRVGPGEKIRVEKLPDGRIEVRAARPTGRISDAFDFLKSEDGPSLSIEEMSKIAARGWAGRR